MWLTFNFFQRVRIWSISLQNKQSASIKNILLLIFMQFPREKEI